MLESVFKWEELDKKNDVKTNKCVLNRRINQNNCEITPNGQPNSHFSFAIENNVIKWYIQNSLNIIFLVCIAAFWHLWNRKKQMKRNKMANRWKGKHQKIHIQTVHACFWHACKLLHIFELQKFRRPMKKRNKL